MTVSIIAAMTSNRVIGRDNALPWRQSSDLKRFKTLTMGHHLVMGRKTYDSLDGPLNGRRIVRTGTGWERVGRRLWPALGGVHLVEATKSIYAPVPILKKKRHEPILARA